MQSENGRNRTPESDNIISTNTSRFAKDGGSLEALSSSSPVVEDLCMRHERLLIHLFVASYRHILVQFGCRDCLGLSAAVSATVRRVRSNIVTLRKCQVLETLTTDSPSTSPVMLLYEKLVDIPLLR
jgi:hypothetical protein